MSARSLSGERGRLARSASRPREAVSDEFILFGFRRGVENGARGRARSPIR
jgi:hypothetical protein